MYSRASDPRARTSSKLSSCRLAAADAGDARAQHRESAGTSPRRRAGSCEKRAHAVGLAALHVHQEHVRAAFAVVSTENSSSRLACSDRTPTMKKAPRPTASRITRVWLPGTREVQHGVAQRKRRRVRERRDRPDQRAARPAAARTPARRSRRRRSGRPCSDAACQAVSATSAGRHEHDRARCASSRAPAAPISSRSSSDGLTLRTSQQRHDRKQQRDEHADADALRRGAPGDAVVHVGQERRGRRSSTK